MVQNASEVWINIYLNCGDEIDYHSYEHNQEPITSWHNFSSYEIKAWKSK